MRILLVEDEPEMARLVISLMSDAKFDIDHVASMADARAGIVAPHAGDHGDPIAIRQSSIQQHEIIAHLWRR